MFASCTGQDLPHGSNVIIVLIDTIRCDRLGVYGFEGDLTPCMDRLAGKGVCFRRTIAPSSWTKPSVASLFTGLYPGRHGAIGGPNWGNGTSSMLNTDHVTLAERLHAVGYRTAALVNNPHILSRFHFDQGFDDFIRPEGDVEQVLAKALEWIRGKKEEDKFFLYLHVMDPHAPYTPPDSFKEKYGVALPGKGALLAREGNPLGIQLWSRQFNEWRPSSPQDSFLFDYERLRSGLIDMYPSMDLEEISARIVLDFNGKDDPALVKRIDYLTSIYNGEVAYTDHALGCFLRKLEEMGLLDETILVVTGDHGEGFLEHGKWGHAEDVHTENVDIPLILVVPGPDGTFQGSYDGLVSLVDLYPTVLEMLGLPLTSNLDGLSLWPVIREEDQAYLPERPVFSELILQFEEQVAAMLGRKKLVRRSTADGTVQWFYYDVAKDPGELEPTNPEGAGSAARVLKKSIETLRMNRTLDFDGKVEIGAPSEEEIRQLRRLGYF